jgi:hypothetical protein
MHLQMLQPVPPSSMESMKASLFKSIANFHCTAPHLRETFILD